jgi:hypothetical protein
MPASRVRTLSCRYRTPAGSMASIHAATPEMSVQLRPWILPTQHSGFAAQHQQFGVLRRCRACQQCHPASQAHEYQVDRPYRHKPALLLLAGSVNEAIEAVEDWEFSTRLGVDKANARALRTELGDLIARLPPE